jgi:hypothetical protein
MSWLSRRDVLKASAATLAAVSSAAWLARASETDRGPAKKKLMELLRDSQKSELRHGYGTRFTHVPMVLIARYRLGASAEQLDAFYATLRRPKWSIARNQRKTPIDASNWEASLGRTDMLHAYVRYFRAQVKASGLGATLKGHAPKLCEGAGSAAFHCLIKLGYALDIADKEEATLSLAYWSAHFQATPVTRTKNTPTSLADLVATLERSDTIKKLKGRGNIVDRMNLVFRQDDFRLALAPLTIAPTKPLHAIAATVRQAYTTHHHFTLLHGLTGTHAMRMLLPYLEKPAVPLTQFGHALAAAYMTAVYLGRADPRRAVPSKHPTTAALAAVGAAGKKNHLVKVTHSCLSEAEAYAEPAYLALAARDQGSLARFS